jgi:cobalt-zinc-cadmium efflux system outer membrane protein
VERFHRIRFCLAIALVAAGASVHPLAAHQQAAPAGPGDDRGAGTPQPLTVGDALSEAMSRNPEIALLRRELDAARTRPGQERFLQPPTLEAQIWQWPVDTLNPANTNMFMAMLGQELPGRGKRRLREALVETDVRLAEADVAVRARAVVERVKRAYVDLSLARRAVAVHHESVDLLRQFADAAQVRYATGGFSQQDVLKAVLELTRVHDHLIGLEQRALLAEARLNALLDRPPDAAIGPLGAPRDDVSLPPADWLQRLALEQQPELASARLAIERAQARAAIVGQEYKPDFFVMGGYMLMPRDRDGWTAKVGVTWPTAPWSRGRLDAQKGEAEAEMAVAAARVRAVENGVRLAVQEAYVRASAARQRASLLRTTLLPQSRQARDASRVAFEADRGDFLALIDSERVRLDAELDYYAALSDAELAFAELERAVGTDLTPGVGVTAVVRGVN